MQEWEFVCACFHGWDSKNTMICCNHHSIFWEHKFVVQFCARLVQMVFNRTTTKSACFLILLIGDSGEMQILCILDCKVHTHIVQTVSQNFEHWHHWKCSTGTVWQTWNGIFDKSCAQNFWTHMLHMHIMAETSQQKGRKIFGEIFRLLSQLENPFGWEECYTNRLVAERSKWFTRRRIFLQIENLAVFDVGDSLPGISYLAH